MESSYFDLNTTGHQPQLDRGGERRRALPGPAGVPAAQVPAASEHDSLRDYWRVLHRRKIVLFLFATTGLILSVLISMVQTPVYRARTSLEIQEFNENFLDLKNVDPTNSSGTPTTGESYFGTQIRILQSRSVLERVADKLNTQGSRPVEGRRPIVLWARRILGLSTSSPPPDKEQLVRQASRSLTLRSAASSRLLDLMYDSPDPKFAADFANTLVSEYIEYTQEMRWNSTRRTGDWLTRHLDDMKAKLEQSEAQLHAYARTSGLRFTAEKDNVAELRLRELQDELSKAQVDRLAKEARLEEAKIKPADSLPEVLDDPTLRDYRVKLTDLERQLVELSVTLTPAHDRVKRVQAQIEELRSAMEKHRSLIVHRVGNEHATARRRERFVAGAYAEQEKIVADQSSKAIHYDTLKRGVDSTRQLYQEMVQRVKQAELAAAMHISNVQVVDPARPPPLPYKPNLVMNAAMGLFGGVFLGLGFVIFRERFDRRIQAPGDVRTYLNLPELGAIPAAEIAPSRESSGNESIAPLRLTAPARLLLEAPRRDCPELAAWNHKPSVLAECFRATLTSVLLAGENGEYPRVVVLTSPSPGDGKTTVASNLSIAMAETDRRVLLIDGDLRRARLHKVFGLPNSWGLSDILGTDARLDETVRRMHFDCRTGIRGLHILPSGSSNLSSWSLFYSDRLSKLLERLRGEFDMILIDAPPLIYLADARVLGHLSDGVILVIRAGQTTPERAVLASQRFAEDGTRVLGTVLNNWNPSASGTGSYYGYKDYLKEYDASEK